VQLRPESDQPGDLPGDDARRGVLEAANAELKKVQQLPPDTKPGTNVIPGAENRLDGPVSSSKSANGMPSPLGLTEVRWPGVVATATAAKRLSDKQLVEVLELVKDADSVELKLTVPESSQRSTVAALDLDPLDAQIRQVYFFDTPELALHKAGVIVRARRIQGKGGDSVVKLRPVVPAELPEEFRTSRNMVVEVDAMPSGFVCSATLKDKLGATQVRATVQGGKPFRKLFSKEQRRFFAANAPEGLELDSLSALGPIFVLKLKRAPEEFGRPLVAELWLYPDGSRILELSTKCPPGDAMQAAAEARAFLTSKGVDLSREQQTKTKRALEFFANELPASG
jgi:hypothetical protein